MQNCCITCWAEGSEKGGEAGRNADCGGKLHTRNPVDLAKPQCYNVSRGIKSLHMAKIAGILPAQRKDTQEADHEGRKGERMYRGRINRFINRNRDRVWFSFALNFLALGVMLLLMSPSFETNDDTTLREFVNGAREHTSPCLLFEHYFLGVIYRLLYLLPGYIPWYTVVQYTVLFLSFTAVTYVVLRRLEGTAGFCAVSILLLFFAKECYISVQFTKTASIAMCAGVLLLVYAAGAQERTAEEKIGREQAPGEGISGMKKSGKRVFVPAAVCGILLGCFGAMYRMKQSVASAALMTGIGLFVLLKALREAPHQRMRSFFPYLKVFALFGLCILALYGTDVLAYHRNPRWLEYSIYNDLRSDLMDYGIPDFGSNEELYAELDIDKDAFLLFSGWNYNDPDKLSPEIIETLLKRQPPRQLSLALVKNFLREFPARYFQTYTFYGFLLLGVLWLFCGYHRREDNLAVLYEIALFGLLYFYTYFSGRYAINRVDTGLWFALALTAVWFLDAGRMRIVSQSAGIFCLCLLFLSQYNWKDYWRVYHMEDDAAREKTRAFVEEISQDREHLYLMKIGLMSTYNAYGIFDRMPRGVLNNTCLLGGWDCSIPEVQDMTALYGVTNPYRDVVDNPSVYIVDNNIDLTLAYIRTYYAPEAEAIQVRELEDRKIYRIVTG